MAPACVPRGARAAWCAGGRLRRSRPTCCARFDQDLIQGVRKPFVQTPSDAITLRRAVRSFTGYWKVDEIGFFSVGTNLILICFSFHIVVQVTKMQDRYFYIRPIAFLVAILKVNI